MSESAISKSVTQPSMALLEHAPRFDTTAAVSLAQRLYGIPTGAITLPSERDQNFLLACDSGEKFVLKIANALEDPTVLEEQNKAIAHLGTRVDFCPRIVATLSGEQMSQIESSTGATHFVRLLTYLPGVPLAVVSQQTPALLRDLGQRLGQLDRAPQAVPEKDAGLETDQCVIYGPQASQWRFRA